MRPFKQALSGLSVIIFLLTATLAAPGARAQQTNPLCDARTSILMTLNGRFDEQPSARGLASNGAVLEVLSSQDGTWTIIVTTPDGLSCMMASGKYWQEVATKVKGIPL